MNSALLPSFSTRSGRPAFWFIFFLLGGLLSTASWPALAQTIQGAGGSEAAQPTGGGTNHKLMLCTDGTVTGWGLNDSGQLGNVGATLPTPAPLSVGLPGRAVRVVSTFQSSFAILEDGALWAWGGNAYGQLGVGSGIASTTTAIRVPTITNVVAIAGSLFNTLALCADGTVWSWGSNQYGALGTGPAGATVYTPQQIPPATLNNIRAIASSNHFCLALDASGHVWSWGLDSFGELGTGRPANTLQITPGQLSLNSVRQLDVTDNRAVALRTDGTVWAWGENASGLLGLNNTAYINVPTQVGMGLIGDANWVAMTADATIAVRPSGNTYIWGDNQYGNLGRPTPAFAAGPISGPMFQPNTQVEAQTRLFTSIEPTGIVKTWGLNPLGYTPASPGPYGSSSQPTTPTGICPSVPPVESFPICGPQRAYFQRSGATYVAALHGPTTSAAEIGTYGTTTVIDASQPPYNGTVVFDGEYHVRGNVQLVGGTFSLLYNTKFYIDGNNGQASQTTLDVTNATLQLHGATLQAGCPERWGGVYLKGYGKLYTEAGGIGKRTTRAVIRDAETAVFCYTPDWNYANNAEYYLHQTDFLNNNTGLYDLCKGTAQPGEGVSDCLFQDGFSGIELESIDYSPTKVYGGDYSQATFDANTFKNLEYGLAGQAGALRVTNSTFVNNYYAATYLDGTGSTPSTVDHLTVVVPAVWPADLLAQFPAGYMPYSTGIFATNATLTGNTVVGATTTPTTNGVKQVGIEARGSLTLTGNVLRYLDEAVSVTINDNFSGFSGEITGNTFTENQTGLRFSGYHLDGYPTGPVTLTLRCNTFATTQPNSVGVWVTSGTPFPASLGTSSTPNGNRFDIGDATKRFVYDAAQPASGNPFVYYRYYSVQEQFGGNGDGFYQYNGSSVPVTVAVANRTTIAGTNACGNSTTPGVYARSVNKTPAPGTDRRPVSMASLSGAYPNPATETATFAYTLADDATPAALVLRDLLGREVARKSLNARVGEVQVSVRQLPAGFYTSALEMAGNRLAGQKLTVVH